MCQDSLTGVYNFFKKTSNANNGRGATRGLYVMTHFACTYFSSACLTLSLSLSSALSCFSNTFSLLIAHCLPIVLSLYQPLSLSLITSPSLPLIISPSLCLSLSLSLCVPFSFLSLFLSLSLFHLLTLSLILYLILFSVSFSLSLCLFPSSHLRC